MARHLTASGVNVELVSNPSRTGWTTQQAIDDELPVWRAARPQLASVQIGVNDWVQGVDARTFQHRLHVLLDAVQQVIPDTNRLFLVTIPDFSVTPTGAMFSGGRNIAAGLAEFNGIIKLAGTARGLQVVDVFVLSQKMKDDPTLIARDGLHPSAKEYALWEEMIFPMAKVIDEVMWCGVLRSTPHPDLSPIEAERNENYVRQISRVIRSDPDLPPRSHRIRF